jgi:uncharacterized membrane protein YqjE
VADRTYQNYSNEKSIPEVLRDVKYELSEFIRTRYELLVAELREKSAEWKRSLPLLAAAIVFGMGTFATLTFTLVSLICAGIRYVSTGTAATFAWPIAALIVCVLYGCVAAALATTALNALKKHSLAPERTLRVLRQDQQWIKNEASDITNTSRAA